MKLLPSLTTSFLFCGTVVSMVTIADFSHAQELYIPPIDEIVVRGTNIPDEKRATAEISSLLTPEKIERAGDSDVAGALRRVTGLSLSDGKFVIVRGLNERYTSLTLNGSPLPSPEPLRRVAPLDLFPTSVVSTVLVQKTYSPNYSGEFGGGVIELRSKSIPDESFVSFKLSGGIDLVTTFEDGLTFVGGGTDFTGFDDGTRDLPAPLAAAFEEFPGVAVTDESDVFDTALTSAIAQSIPFTELALPLRRNVPINHSLGISGGTSYDISNDVRFGIVANFGYARNFQLREGERDNVQFSSVTGEVTTGTRDTTFESLTEEILLNGLISAGLEIGDNHSFDVTGIVLRKTVKEARNETGTETASFDGFDLISTSTEFFENQVASIQGNSEHFFPSLSDLSIKTRVAYSEAFRDAPFETESLFGSDGTTFISEDGSVDEFRSLIGESESAFSTAFSGVDDENFSGGLDIELPLTIFNRDHSITVGGAYTQSNRFYAIRQFTIENEPGLTGLNGEDPFFFQPIDLITAPQSFGANAGIGSGLSLREQPDVVQPSAYTGDLEVFAGYVQFDVALTDYIQLAAGVRYETSEQLVDNFSVAALSSSDALQNSGFEACPGFNEGCINEDYFLPAVTLTWNFGDNLQARGAFSQTIIRPQFQELGASVFTDTDRDISIFGNPFLVNTEIDNFDLRIEYYFGREQFITIGGFYKDLLNPIEETFIQTGDDISSSFVNTPSAELYGIEFEYEQRFFLPDLIGDTWLGDSDLVFSTNYTWSQSEVSADGTVVQTTASFGEISPDINDAAQVIVDGRSLQGQSDHIVNGQLGLQGDDYRAFFLLNWNSARIRQVGLITGAAVPDLFERLPFGIDFVYAKNFELFGSKDWELEFKVQNILGDDYEATVTGTNDTVVNVDVFELGQNFSFSIEKRF